MRKISIINFKGGIGKTSLAINLADELSRRNRTVLLIDCDRQRNASSMLPPNTSIGATLKEVLMGQAPIDAAIYEARLNLWVVPAHTDLEQAAKHITVSGPRTLKLLRNAIESLDGVDYVLLDHAPSYSPITDAALLASDEMLIPVQLEAFSITGLVDMIDKLTESLAELEHQLSITGIVPSNLDYTKTMTTRYLETLKQHFGAQVTSPIRTDAQISKSQSVGKTVFEYNPRSKGTQDYAALAALLEQGVLVS